MTRLRDPRLTDALIAIALATVLLAQLAFGEHEGNAVLNVAGGLLLTLPLAVRRSRPLAVAGIFTATAAIVSLLGAGLFTGEPPQFACLVAGAVTFYSLGAHAEDRAAQVGAALGVAGLWISVVGSDHSDVQSFLFSGGLIVATPWLVGRSTRARAQRLALLEQEALQRERVAVGEERARIARELHDVVAHSVGGMVAQAQGARAMLDRDPERAREALEAIERTGRHALDEMRRSLGVLRRSDADAPLAPQPGLRRRAQPRGGGRRERPSGRAADGGRAGGAAGRRRPVGVSHRPGGADERAQARGPGASPRRRALRRRRDRARDRERGIARPRPERQLHERWAGPRSGCASGSRSTAASCTRARGRRAASS